MADTVVGKLVVIVKQLECLWGVLIPGVCTARAALAEAHSDPENGDDRRWLKYWAVWAVVMLVETSTPWRVASWTFSMTEGHVLVVALGRLAATHWLAFGGGATTVYAVLEQILIEREALVEAHLAKLEASLKSQLKEYGEVAAKRALLFLQDHAAEAWRLAQCYASAKAAAAELATAALERADGAMGRRSPELLASETTPGDSMALEPTVADEPTVTDEPTVVDEPSGSLDDEAASRMQLDLPRDAIVSTQAAAAAAEPVVDELANGEHTEVVADVPPPSDDGDSRESAASQGDAATSAPLCQPPSRVDSSPPRVANDTTDHIVQSRRGSSATKPAGDGDSREAKSAASQGDAAASATLGQPLSTVDIAPRVANDITEPTVRTRRGSLATKPAHTPGSERKRGVIATAAAAAVAASARVRGTKGQTPPKRDTRTADSEPAGAKKGRSPGIVARLKERRRKETRLTKDREQRRQEVIDRALAPLRSGGVIVDIARTDDQRPAMTRLVRLVGSTLVWAPPAVEPSVLASMWPPTSEPPDHVEESCFSDDGAVEEHFDDLTDEHPPKHTALVRIRRVARSKKRIRLVVDRLGGAPRNIAFDVSSARAAITLGEGLQDAVERARARAHSALGKAALRICRSAFDAWFISLMFRPKCLDD